MRYEGNIFRPPSEARSYICNAQLDAATIAVPFAVCIRIRSIG